MTRIYFFLLAFAIVFSAALPASADGYKNYANPSGELPDTTVYQPGMTVYLPGGQTVVIQDVLQDGTLRASDGTIISREGVIQSGEYKGVHVTREKETVILDKSQTTRQVVVPETSVPAQKVEENTPGIALPTTPIAEKEVVTQKKEAVPQQKTIVPETGQSGTPHTITLAEMLPLTDVKNGKQIKPVQEKPNSEQSPKKAEKVAKGEATPKPEKTKSDPKQEKAKGEAKQNAGNQAAPKAGQPMRIPQDAIKSGKLDFLEGCWQGTRPEYTTKRTVRECFCFNKGGKSGKRKIFDPIGHRECIGASKATLSSSGVLSVTSQNMVCSDGERWGAAEMQCRNSGPKTPCSWIFTDAGNGRQAYEIPFIRVESCRR